MCEQGYRASHNESYDGPNIRPRQLRHVASGLRSRETPWEGSPGSNPGLSMESDTAVYSKLRKGGATNRLGCRGWARKEFGAAEGPARAERAGSERVQDHIRLTERTDRKR